MPFRCEFSYQTNSQKSKKAIAGAQGLGLEMGGELKEQAQIKQLYDVKFWDEESLRQPSPQAKRSESERREARAEVLDGQVTATGI